MTNVVGTRRLVEAVAPRLASGRAAILLSSLAGRAPAPVSPIDSIIEAWRDPELIARLTPHLEALDPADRAGRCYVVAKRMIIHLCKALAVEWSRRGVRIVSVSPGLVDTPMGRAEAARNPAARGLPGLIPLGRLGRANDVALAVAFLASPSASYITGCDLQIDGGLQAALETAAAGT